MRPESPRQGGKSAHLKALRLMTRRRCR